MKTSVVIWVVRLNAIVAAVVAYVALTSVNDTFGIIFAGWLSTHDRMLSYLSAISFAIAVRLCVFGLKFWKRLVMTFLLSFLCIPIIILLPSSMAITKHGVGPDFGIGLAWLYLQFVFPTLVAALIFSAIPFLGESRNHP